MIQCDDGRNAHDRFAMPDVDTGALRESILNQTTGVIRRRCWCRCWVRRAAIGSALAVCYLAGLCTMHVWKAAEPEMLAAAVNARSAVSETAAPDNVAPQRNIVAKAETEKRAKPKQKPKRPKLSRFEAICRISDRYLYRDADAIAAIRGYRRALRVATPEELKICPRRDSWVLIALKQELIRKENRDENRG